MDSIHLLANNSFSEEDIDCLAAWLNDGEAEIATYHAAVESMFGACLAEWAALDWIRGVEAMLWPPENKESWRGVTELAIRRLAVEVENELVGESRYRRHG